MLKSLSPIDVALIKKIGGNGSSYTLPIASPTQLGGVRPVSKTGGMTQAVGVDEDGRLWTAPSTGGETTHGIVWDLTNVTSSNNAVSVADGASLVAVLTAENGYTLGDVTVTMGGEALTGVWNANTATVTITSVTGDVIISCAGVATPVETPLEVTWVNGKQTDGIVIVSPTTPANVFVEPLIDGTNTATKIIFRASADYLVATPINQVRLFLYSDAEGQNFVGSWNLAQNAVAEGDTATQSVDLDTAYIIPAGYYVRVFMSKGYGPANFSSNANLKSYVTGGFVEFYAVSAGSAVEATSLSVDDDYAMNYGISTMSLVVDDMTSAEASNAGIDQTFANTVISAMNSWMKEYRGNINKIPLIIHTDQHGRLTSHTKPLFDLLNSKVNWYEVSKIMNLGDTVSDRWSDVDSAEPLLECTALENMLECVSAVPFSKRLDVFGNHDTWYTNAGGEDTVLTSFAHLSQYFKNIYARRFNNKGYFTVCDDYYNVKYIVVSGFEYATSRSTYRISTAQMGWLIEEMGKDDGYDIVIVSHVPLYYQPSTELYPTGMTPSDEGSTVVSRLSNVDTDTLFNARKNKTSGTVTDSDGVEHTFDFSGCTTDILCGLHGHIHMDAYNYVGSSGLVSVTFDWFDDNTMHFVLVDRVNRQLNVWKVDSTNTVQNYQVPLDKATE